MSAKLDEAGQKTALGGSASKTGLACGPIVAGYVLATDSSYPLLIWLAIGAIVVCSALAFHPAKSLDAQV